jgi:hypothetical protein
MQIPDANKHSESRGRKNATHIVPASQITPTGLYPLLDFFSDEAKGIIQI